MSVTRAAFGAARDGSPVELWTLERGGLSAEILTYGGTIRSLRVPGRDGAPVDVVLGYDTLAEYEENGGYLGALVGRYANRIAGARCRIDGGEVPLEASEGPNQLHGGLRGFSHRVFRAEAAGDSALRLTYTAAHGEGGFPGELRLTADYALTDRGLTLRYQAVSDRATYCNITNHSYFNLNGGGDAMGHRLWLASHQFTPVDAGSIPTAMAAPVSGTPFDFTEEKPLGRDIGQDCQQLRLTGGYDHNFVLDPAQGLRLAGRLTGEKTGIVLEVWTTKPGTQLYTANGLPAGLPGKGGAVYGPRQGVCLETQFFPDSPNHPEWGDIVLRPGGRYDHTTEYRFSAPD